jgi:hypothetical protein
MRKIKQWFWGRVYMFEYRKVDEDVCCCGSSDCGGDYTHSYVNAKQHAIETAVSKHI